MLLSSALLITGQGQSLEPVPRNLMPGYDTIREETLRAELTFLSSDALQGRMSLQPGDYVAIEWIASEFKKAGLEPCSERLLL
jgi:hypothetical protein